MFDLFTPISFRSILINIVGEPLNWPIQLYRCNLLYYIVKTVTIYNNTDLISFPHSERFRDNLKLKMWIFETRLDYN